MGAIANTLEEKICPQCHGYITVSKGYVTWCDKCNWNLQSSKIHEPKTIFEQIYLRAGEKSNQALLQSLIQKKQANSTFSKMKLMTLLVSTFIHLVSLSFFLGGCYLLISDFPNLLFILIGASLIVLAWFTSPKPYKLRSRPLPSEQFPTLYKIADEISSLLQAEKIHGILIDGTFNASFAQYGWKQKKILRLGLPLFTVLDKQELTALISHEIAHGINGDLNRGLYVSSAIDTLSTWYQVTKPFDTRHRDGAFLMIFANIFLFLISKIVYSLLYLLCHLNWYDSQRAEYLADQLACKTAGKEPTLLLLNKLHLHELFDFTILKVINTNRYGHFFDDFLEQVHRMPAKELERIKRIEQLSHSRLDATHPPTVSRIAYIQSLDIRHPNYTMDDETFLSIRNELSTLNPKVEKQLLDDYKLRYIQF